MRRLSPVFKISKEFTFPMGHRLYKHNGACRNIHGHNFRVIVGLKSPVLDENGMVMDFADLKQLSEVFLGQFDHALLLNKEDVDIADKLKEFGFKIHLSDVEPTAENFAKAMFNFLDDHLSSKRQSVDYVTVYENDTSSATFTL